MLDGKCKYRVSAQNILKTQITGNTIGMEVRVEQGRWVSDDGCHRAFLWDVMVWEIPMKRKWKEGKGHLS